MQKYLLFVFTILLATNSYAGFISKDSCKKVAINFYFEKTGKHPIVSWIENDTIGHGHIVGYVFNFTKGFVKLRNQNSVNPVTGWDADNHYTFKNIPKSQRGLIHAIQHERENCKAAALLKTTHTHQWGRLTAGIVKVTVAKTVGPLLTTTWGQEPLYNFYCPNHSSCGAAVTGCVATAMSQIMKYWNYPPTGAGNNCYTDTRADGYSYDYGTFCDTFSKHSYQWGNMLNAATNANYLSIAQLMYDAAISVNMDFGNDCEGGSGAYVLGGAPSAQAAFVNIFGYKNTIHGLIASCDTCGSWLLPIKADLDVGLVVELEGFDPSGAGHTYPCDGYQLMSDGSLMFHINWGWLGADNGWFSLANLAVSGYNFSTSEGALLGIQPAGSTPPPTPCASPVLNPASSITTSSATLSWTGTDSAYIGSINGVPFTTTSNSYTATGLLNNTTYNWQLTGVCKGGSLSGTPTSSFKTLALPCGPSTLLTVTINSSTQTTLSWTPNVANTAWNIYWYVSTGSGITYNTIRNVTSPYTFPTTPATKYGWYVNSICGTTQANSPEYQFTSGSGNTPPPCTTPTVTATSTTTTATLSWTGLPTDSFNLTFNGVLSKVKGLTTTVSGLMPNTAYNYSLSHLCGATSASTSGSVTTKQITCPAPTFLKETPTVQATISWTGSATNYILNYKIASATNYTPVTGILGNSYTISNVVTDSLYNFNVVGVCNGVNSVISTGSFVGGK